MFPAAYFISSKGLWQLLLYCVIRQLTGGGFQRDGSLSPPWQGACQLAGSAGEDLS